MFKKDKYEKIITDKKCGDKNKNMIE